MEGLLSPAMGMKEQDESIKLCEHLGGNYF